MLVNRVPTVVTMVRLRVSSLFVFSVTCFHNSCYLSLPYFYLGIKDNLIANNEGIFVIEYVPDELLCVEFPAH